MLPGDTHHRGVRSPASAGGLPMRVLLTSTSYPADANDWKGLFIQRMIEGLARRPELTLEAWCPPGPLPPGVKSTLEPSEHEWLLRLGAQGGIAQLLRKRPIRGLSSGRTLLSHLGHAFGRSHAHLFHVNWLQCALALPDDGRPALVTALGTDLQLLRLPLVRHWLRRRFAGRRVALCPNSDWMVAPLQRAFGDMADVVCVPFGIDAPWYQAPRSPAQMEQSPRWLCVSRLTPGKLGPLFEWCEPHFRGQRRQLHLIGPLQDAGVIVPAWVHFHGPATPAQLRENWFPRATGLLSLSQHPEGRPQVMLEAMAAGLPILASPLPAHQDIVGHGRTGWLCAGPAQLQEGLTALETPDRNLALGTQAREEARRRFGTWDDCASRYAMLYEGLLR